MVKISSQNKYPCLKFRSNRIERLLCIALGDASNVVIVVLNIAVKAAIEIIKADHDPSELVYNAIS